jgi:hopanoid-associated phosphorylase
MKREARIVSGLNVRVVIGGDGSRIVQRIDVALDSTVQGIISIGIAGALAPELKIGDCLVATRVQGNTAELPCDARWQAQLLRLLPNAKAGTLIGVRAPATNVQGKAALRAASNADAVDMESDLAAEAAARRGLPFAALRVISDTAADALPPATAAALNPDGGINLMSVLASILKQPSQIPALICTGRNADTALAALLRCHDLLGVGLGCPYLG